MPTGAWWTFERGAVRLACRDFGGDGPPVLLLHGLAGHAEEWAQTAGSLTARHRVLALDARGHGRSERRPADCSLASPTPSSSSCPARRTTSTSTEPASGSAR